MGGYILFIGVLKWIFIRLNWILEQTLYEHLYANEYKYV